MNQLALAKMHLSKLSEKKTIIREEISLTIVCNYISGAEDLSCYLVFCSVKPVSAGYLLVLYLFSKELLYPLHKTE